MKHLTFLVSTIFFTAWAEEVCTEEEKKKSTLQCNNQSIVVDEYLNFTWSTDKVMTYDLMNLVETPENQGEDYSVPVIHGHFEL